MSKKDKLLECRYGAFVSSICNGTNNKDISWEDMHTALLRVINTDSTCGSRPRHFKVEELPSAAFNISYRDRVANLLKIYEVLEDHISVLPTERDFE
jgi:hypothetical protein